jgi:ABC-type Fe3+ transport system substrate-binding protein
MLARLIILAVFAALLGVPLALRPTKVVEPDAGTPRLIVITPHSEQIRAEFGRAFSEWHEREHGEQVFVDFRAPGGTSEIQNLLRAEFKAAARDGKIGPDGAASEGAMSYDLLFGGGSYEHDLLKRGVEVVFPGGERATIAISEPAGFSETQMAEWFGDNVIGPGPIADPEQYWIGSALTSFGIVFNRDLLRAKGLPDPLDWEALTDHRYDGWLALTDPRQSGSVTTTYDAILSHYGFDEGWRVLRAMCANAHSFADSSQKAPIEVSMGEAAAGLSIGFYGRYQSQAVAPPGTAPEESRVGFLDPPGMTYIDSDPISIIRGGPNPVLARRFLEFTLTDEGQALWQFPARERLGDASPADGLGPWEHELRRMPARPAFYEKYRVRFIDKDLRPFEVVTKTPVKGWRSLISPIMAASSIDIHSEQSAAWRAIEKVKTVGAPTAFIEQLENEFFLMPMHELPDGKRVLLSEEQFRTIREDWRDPDRAAEHRIAYTRFFREQYEKVERMAEDWLSRNG